MEPISFQVETRNPNGGRGDYWGVAQQHFANQKEAAEYALEDCPFGWQWRVVRVRADVVESGKREKALTGIYPLGTCIMTREEGM